VNNRRLVTARPDEAVGVNMLRGDCRYWTVDFEVWSVLIVAWAAGVAIHATFQNRHFQPPKIRGLGLGRTEEKFADSDANSESVTTLLFSGHGVVT